MKFKQCIWVLLLAVGVFYACDKETRNFSTPIDVPDWGEHSELID